MHSAQSKRWKEKTRFCLSLMCLLLVAAAVSLAQGAKRPAAIGKIQTPREAALELLFARDVATVEKHLPQTTLDALQKLEPEDRQNYLEGKFMMVPMDCWAAFQRENSSST